VRCPFAPWCDASLDVNFGDALVGPYPSHDIESDDPSMTGTYCPGSHVRMMRSGRPHTSEDARLAELMSAYAEVESARIRDERADRENRGGLRAVPDLPAPEEIEREAREFDEFAERAARVVEERMRERNAGHDVPLARDGLDEQTIREILDDDSIRLVDRGDGPDAARSGPRRRADDPDDNVVPLRREQVPPGVPLGRGQVRPDDEYPSGAELDPELDLTPIPIEGHEDDIEGYAVGAGPDRPIDEFYPGRPADAPEPGPGDPPAERVPFDIGGEHLGRAAVDNAREQLQALLGMVIEQLGQTGDTLAKATGLTESVEAQRLASMAALGSAQSLMTTAVGGGGQLAAGGDGHDRRGGRRARPARRRARARPRPGEGPDRRGAGADQRVRSVRERLPRGSLVVGTYEGLHAGDLVLGDDGEVWGVSSITHAPRLVVTLVRHEHAVTGTPPPGTPVTVVQRADVTAEFAAAATLIAGLGSVELIGETWTE
jgi:hypothetical protein